MRIHDILLSEPIAIHEPALQVWLARISPYMQSLAGNQQTLTANLQEAGLTLADFINVRNDYQVIDGIAVIHVNDVLGRGLLGIDKFFGATDYNSLIAELAQAVADPLVSGIFIDINSPGGSVIGVPEAASALAAAAAIKPVVSYIEMLGASAAIYFAAASSYIVASNSAVVGSVGTIGTFANISGLLANFGVKIEQITSGDLKAAGTPYRDMTLDEKNFLNTRVQDLGAEFRAWVQSYRPGVEGSSMRGQWFSGSQAANLGLVDQVGDRSDALQSLQSLMDYVAN